ncbi:unnamed protein product [Enterobius vermicularis]|uniref:Uncharacterized protein n=1 Tax=Enterobius vermicularis TaxID=51028 RepID=A0A0N4VR10_ENTVE|nr:unnamed protein product [Enterobius vermicularis]
MLKLYCRTSSHSRSHSEYSVAEGNVVKPALTPKLSVESTGENRNTDSPSLQPKRKFRQAHQSFRIRMLQEQYGVGFEPVKRQTVFFCKKKNASLVFFYLSSNCILYQTKTNAFPLRHSNFFFQRSKNCNKLTVVS